MAISKEQKKLLNDKIKPYKHTLDDIKKESATIRAVGRKDTVLEPYVQMQLAVLGLQRANTLLLMSRLSIEIQNLKNESYLNDARKEVSNKLNDLLKIVGDDIDGSLTENSDRLASISLMNPTQRLHLLEGFKKTANDVKDCLGSNSKWRWSFPDLHFKLALLAKNIFDFQEYGRSKDPNEEYYPIRQEILRFITDALQFAAQEYRSRFELSTKEVSDLQMVQRIFELVIKIFTIVGNQSELGKIRTSLDAIKENVERLMAEKAGKKKK